MLNLDQFHKSITKIVKSRMSFPTYFQGKIKQYEDQK